MRYNDTMVGAATATGRTDNGGSSTGPHINSAASIAARLHAAAAVELQAVHAATRAMTATKKDPEYWDQKDPEYWDRRRRIISAEKKKELADIWQKIADEEIARDAQIATLEADAAVVTPPAVTAAKPTRGERGGTIDANTPEYSELEKQAHSAEVDFLRAQITVLEGRVARRTTQRDEFKCHLKTRDEDVARLEEEVKRLRGDLENVGHDVTTTTEQRDTLESLLTSRDEDVANLHEEVAHLRGDLESAHATIGELTPVIGTRPRRFRRPVMTSRCQWPPTRTSRSARQSQTD